MGGPSQCKDDNWPECVVYELGGYSFDGRVKDNKTGKCAVNRTILRQLRRKHGLPGYGAPEEDVSEEVAQKEAHESWLSLAKDIEEEEADTAELAARSREKSQQRFLQRRCKSVLNACHQTNVGKYVYTLCTDTLTQSALKLALLNSTFLWKWSIFHTDSYSLGSYFGVDAKGLLYKDGTPCRNGAQRSVSVRLECGQRGLIVSEGFNCSYSAVFEHSCFCTDTSVN